MLDLDSVPNRLPGDHLPLCLSHLALNLAGNENQRKKKLIELKAVTNSEVYEMSGVSSAGVTEILRELRKVIDKANKPEVLEVEDKPWRP